ncbi:MAG: hypothetical protein ACRDZ1_11575 [Acidimicrobiia bacterium]
MEVPGTAAVRQAPPRLRRGIAAVAFLGLVAGVVFLLLTATRYGPTDDVKRRRIDDCPLSRTDVDDPSLVELARSGDSCRAKAIVRAWDEEGRLPRVRRAIYWDFEGRHGAAPPSRARITW